MDKCEFLTIKLEQKIVKTTEKSWLGAYTQEKNHGWVPDHVTQQLNKFGEHGWELVCINSTNATVDKDSHASGGTNGFFATFKRRIQSS